MSQTYLYTARGITGELVTGSLVAQSRAEAMGLLRMRSLVLTSLTASQTFSVAMLTSIAGSLSMSSSRAVAFRSLAALIHAGLPLRKALEIVAGQVDNKLLREAFLSVAADIESGTTLSDALVRYRHAFPQTISAMIHAGEIAGNLDEAFQRIAVLLERSNTVRRKTLSAIAYPAFVTITALGLVLFLVGTVMPAMKDFFQSANRPLPLITQALISCGGYIRDPWAWLACVAIACLAVGVVRTAYHYERWALLIEQSRLRLPIVGTLFRLSEISMSTRTLGTLLISGVPIESALDITRETVASYSLRKALLRITEHARLGQSLASGFMTWKTYGTHIAALVRAGEEAGTLGEMLLSVAEYTDSQLESTLATVSTLLEPVLIVGIGGIVGLIVAAILIPLYNSIGTLS